jgi:hypothetical protein
LPPLHLRQVGVNAMSEGSGKVKMAAPKDRHLL